jgi:outer membrane protein assembly factor BamB
MAGVLFVLLWWVFFSRAPWLDRLGAIALMVAAMAVTPRILDRSIVTGMMGMMFFFYATPVLCLAFVIWAVAARRLSAGPRRVSMVLTILLACAGWALVRTNGMTAEASSDLAWRWAPTAEDRLLANANEKVPSVPTVPATLKAPEPAPVAPEPVAAKVPVETVAAPKTIAPPGADWPGFRGPNRDDSVPGVRIETDWTKSPPVELWRRPVGPGWSSFAVHGDLVYTQEQRGSEEVVACYNLSTGKPVWKHADLARFWESNAGAGPRATPTLYNGRAYSFGATGIVNALDARTGAVIWSRNGAADAAKKTPEWGFASSPLVNGDAVIVAVSGKLVSYDLATGEPRWFGPDEGVSYSSPQLAKFDGVPQVLLLSTTGATSVGLDNGAPLWKHAWPGYPIVQPALADGDVFISVSDSSGTRRLAATHGSAGWNVETRWTSMGLKPYFNDFVVHNGHAFGFDGSLISCIDLKDGKRIWKGGRYGHGQLLLLPDQDVLLLISEEGELALVSAGTDQFKELARRPAIEGKTWNHPVLAGDVLLVRNGAEMAAFRLATAK